MDCTDMYIPVYTVYRLVYTGIYWYILRILRYRLPGTVQTGIYRYILCTDWYIPVYTGIYCVYCGIDLSRDCTDWYIPIYYVQTGIYWYIPVYTQIYCYVQDFVEHIAMQ